MPPGIRDEVKERLCLPLSVPDIRVRNQPATTRHTVATSPTGHTDMSHRQIEKTSGQRQVAKSIIPSRIVQHRQDILLPSLAIPKPSTIAEVGYGTIHRLPRQIFRPRAHEALRNTRRRALFDAQDDIDRRRERLISDIEGKLEQKTTLLELFSFSQPLLRKALEYYYG